MNKPREDDPHSTELRSFRGCMLKQQPFYRECTSEMFCLALYLGLRPEQAEAVAQVVWQKFFEHGPACSEANAAQCRAWLLAVAQQETVNWYRARNRHKCQSLDALPVEPIDDRGEGSSAAEKAVILEELENRMMDLRKRDPINYRLLVGHHIEGRDIQELAEAEGLTVRAVWNRLARSRARLRERLTRFREKLDFT